ncbi:MAG: HIT domain-containing protein [Planctomycetes bacterium]|nr:HIT domain-containing protein [Planctomycetota bacterium]
MEWLWAPWRSQYVTGLASGGEGGCFLCAARDTAQPKAALLLGRGQHTFVIMNRFPYNTGHLMVASNAHLGQLEEIDAETTAEIWQQVVVCKQVLQEVIHPHGFNIGINQGRCSGAGVADHLHIHIVPRWDGDTNFMPVLGGAKVMSQSLEDLYEQLQPAFAGRGVML